MRIQHNIMAMSAYRNYTNNVSAMKSNLEKLSSGYKINRAGDDAAGLAISEKMRAQITGLETAQKNAKDGISLVQTAEGALTEVHDMLNRMVELATQSANGTYDNETDRAQLQKEMDQLRDEINRIADSSNFNGIKLLDGSMQEGAVVGAEYEAVENSEILNLIPKTIDVGQPTVEAQNTIVETDGAKPTAASFSIKLDNLNVVDNDTLNLDIGGKTAASVNITKGMSAADVAALFDGQKVNLVDAEGNKAEFEISVAEGDTSLQFKATDTTPFDPPKTVTFSLDSTPDPTDTPTVEDWGSTVDVTVFAKGGTYANTDISAITNLTASNTTAFDADAITNLAREKGFSGAVSLRISEDGQTASIYVGEDKLIDATMADGSGNATTLTNGIAGVVNGGTVNKVVLTFADMGATTAGTNADITLTGSAAASASDAASTADVAAADLLGQSFDLGLTVSATENTDIAVELGDDLADALEEAGVKGTDYDKATIAYNETDGWTLQVAGKTIALTADDTGGVLTLKDGSNNEVATIDVNDTNATEADYALSFQNSGVVLAQVGVAPTVTGTINGAVQNIQVGSDGASDQVANTTIDLSEYLQQDGTKITLGDTTYTVALGADSKFKTAENVIDLTDMDADNFDAKVAATRLTTVAKENNGIFSIGHDGAGNTTLQQLSSAKDSTDMTTRENIANYIGISTVDAKSLSNVSTGRSLTLQIGDTADSYNQLKVDVKDCHTSSLGIADISIADQESAQAAVDAIKNAINYVSDVRGTLGATQNRLDHTINNLSVMTENIQDAESTIRDVDVAEEMMAYTKNNILIQASQAMLAQANQVPQGVLQLLQ